MKKTKPELKDGERLDDLMINNMKIFQHERQFCFTLDAILLAHFAFIKTKAKCVDLGTGTGVIALLLAARGALHIEALELNPIMVELANRSVQLNALEDIITVHQADLRQVQENFVAGHFDLVVSNPPYRPLTKGNVNQLDAVASARHEITAKLEDVVVAAKHLLKYRGRFAMVHLPERLAEIIVEMHRVGIEPKRLQMVHSMLGKKPTMMLIEGVVGAKPGMTVEAPLIVYEADGSYTSTILRYYQEEKQMEQ